MTLAGHNPHGTDWHLGDPLEQATRLHDYLLKRHWNGSVLEGPDPRVRFNYRIGRFVKSYLPAIRWRDTYCFVQAQGYWTLANWRLFAETGAQEYRDLALRCSHSVVQRQRPDGAWDYPIPEWRGRVTTTEGTWGALGLLETYLQTGDPVFLASIRRWHAFLLRSIRFEQIGDQLAINYFADREPLVTVPNNSAILLRFLSELGYASGDSSCLAPCSGLLKYLQAVQKENGEFPYALQYAPGGRTREHFQCYQYHGFLCLDLIRFYERTADETVLPLTSKVLSFLRTGVGEDGHVFYQCGNQHRSVAYHAAVLAAAFLRAGVLGITGYEELARRTYSYVARLQQADGGLPYSRGDYRYFSDRRCYPRQLAMILFFLMERSRSGARNLVPAG